MTTTTRPTLAAAPVPAGSAPPVTTPIPTQYDAVADAYESRIVPRFRPIADLLVAAASPRPGDDVVEIGAGSGGLSRLIAPRLAGSGSLTLTDLSEPMLAIAERLVRPAARGVRLEVRAADLRSLPFPDAAFDLVLAMLTPLQDVPVGLADAHRVLRPDGRLGLVCWGRTYAEVELLNRVRTSLGMPTTWATPRSTVTGRIRRAGFRDVRLHETRLPFVHDDIESYLAYRKSFGVPAGTPDEVYARYLAALREAARDHLDGNGRLVLDWSVFVVTARA
jgi:SAM-dependent methyltransferase